MSSREFEVRMPQPDELPLVQQLRHDELDPERPVPSDERLSDKDFDANNIHVAGFMGGQVVSTVRLDKTSEDGDTYNVRKMATKKEHRGKRLGAQVLAVAEDEAIKRGALLFTLDARKEAIGFYERQGYELTGEDMISRDAILNFRMTKRVK